MILYTYQAQELIFPVQDTEYEGVEMVDIPGGQLQVQRQGEDNSYRVVRLLSTDPNLYLDERYQPGQPYFFDNR
ncbi:MULTISPECIES: YlzJ-like family protein [Bacillaceae]|uniref:YlzJ-like family protein n=1 Tax=Evansella alkalicola TaxID=745819 RepID=A0ABS6K010_9BACI|nr:MULTISPECIES: YlzJ-like family protein [Bacillaceae]MBU9722685.1 YlzJ-like family protein [Bacillus alkalicola]